MPDLDFSDLRTLQPTTSIGDPERVLARAVVNDAHAAADAMRAPARTFKRQIDCSSESARDCWGAAWGR